MRKLDRLGYSDVTETIANQVATELQIELDLSDNDLEVLAAFHQEMAHQKQDSFEVLEMDGAGLMLRNAFAWWFDDESVLIAGWSDEETIVTAALGPGAIFNVRPLYDGKIQTLH